MREEENIKRREQEITIEVGGAELGKVVGVVKAWSLPTRGNWKMPVRFKRTLDFLSRGKLHLKDTVKVVAIFYNGVGSSSSGLRDFMKENLAQIQYKNPRVQIVAFKDTKAPAQITVYHKDNICNKAFIDCRYKGSRHIMEELTTTSGKTE